MTFIPMSEYTLEVAKGNVNGTSSVLKFGNNPDIGTVEEDLWSVGGSLVYLTSSETQEIASSSANDSGTSVTSGTATGGSTITLIDTGATFVSSGVVAGDTLLNDTKESYGIIKSVDSEIQVTVHVMISGTPSNESGDTYRIVNAGSTGVSAIQVQGVDSSHAVVKEFIIMNGITDVTTSNSYLRVFRMFCLGAGSNGSNVGTINATATTSATIQAQMDPDQGQTLMAIYTVPAGKTAYVCRFFYSINKKTSLSADVRFFTRTFGGSWTIKSLIGGNSTGDNSDFRDFCIPLKLKEKTDIRMTGICSTGGGDISGGFDMYLVDN